MFTGIIEEIGTITAVEHLSAITSLSITAEKVLTGMNTGDSIAVNGVCLTVTETGRNEFKTQIMEVTLRNSSLNSLQRGNNVNLERSLTAIGRFHGHIVTGHVDAVGTVAMIIATERGIQIWIGAGENIISQIVLRGSVAINGVSLTVSDLREKEFQVSLIPFTINNTCFKGLKTDDLVNIEVDILAKYIFRAAENYYPDRKERERINIELLNRSGFAD
ncbi:MAG: riboflavin synthase [Candidatus Cloacimonetes bacterium]|nr:riboflavin synthase [Candidatus Cloacimonadota bacterium]